MTADVDQDAAVEVMCHEPIAVVTGGPGVGKTTCTRQACDWLDANGISYALCAPTGKAARRMREATGRTARTIHRLLEWSPEGFRRHAQDPLGEQRIICDESSMIDIRLASWLLDAIAAGTHVTFVGDANQLPPVGPGAFFRDLIASDRVPVITLKTLHRAAQDSWICRNAPKVLSGEPLELDDIRDFEWWQMDGGDAEHVGQVVLDIIGKIDRPQDEVQVLTPMKKRKGGTEPLNAMLQAHLNSSRGLEYKVWDQAIKQGDRIMQTRNDYTLGVFNGEVGIVSEVMRKHLVVKFDDTYVKYDHDAAKNLQLAYAMTIHKSQGSEWPAVIVVCHSEHSFMLSRQLLYTAMTRAKGEVYLVGDERGLQIALRTVKDAKRRTLLQQRLRGEL
jgi:exodeoxyribonuclease V alpha subunit